MISNLNPEAPEFVPDLMSFTAYGYSIAYDTVKSSNVFPGGNLHRLFDVFPEFRKLKSNLRNNAIELTNLIIQTELPSIELKFDNEFNAKTISGLNDFMLDRAFINMDILSGDYITNQPVREGIQMVQQTPHKTHNESGVIEGSNNISPPQLSFKDHIDNSSRMWVPKISDKPNSIKPLALKILYNEEGEAVGYEHPYDLELNMYSPPKCFLIDDDFLPLFPPSLVETKLTILETESDIDQLVRILHEAQEIAVDVEHHSYRSYQGFTCLIQLSTRQEDFIIDALVAREYIHKLNIIFTDPSKLKIFHGAEMDVMWLQRDFGLYIVGMFDTHQAAKVLSLQTLSLAGLLLKYCNVTANKTLQLADWRIRPLTDELIDYARTDTHYLIYIWERMRTELLNLGPGAIIEVFERSKRVCKLTYRKQVINDSSHMPLFIRSGKYFNSQQMAALRVLYQWRDSNARLIDESTHYVLPNFMMLSLAEKLPREVQGIAEICRPMPPCVKQNLLAVHRMIFSCRQESLQPVLYPIPSDVGGAMPQPDFTSYDLVYFNQYNQGDMYYPKPTINPPDARLLMNTYRTRTANISGLKFDAITWLTPFDRYRKYRSLLQVEEVEDYEKRAAEIRKLAKGKQLVKRAEPQKQQEDKNERPKEEAAFNSEIYAVAGPSHAYMGESYNKEEQKDTTAQSFYYNSSNSKNFYDDDY